MTPELSNSNTKWETFRQTRHFGSLDGLRGLSILAVILHHIDWDSSAPITDRGQLGVRLFFAISGFLITTLLLREKHRNGRVSMKAFIMRRTLRIFPLYYAVIAVYCLLVTVIEADSAAGTEFWAHLPSFLTYTSNWFVDFEDGSRTIFYFAWSLATEEQFYLVFPWIIALCTMRGTVVALLLVLSSTFAHHSGWLGLEDSLFSRILWMISPCITLGALFAHALHRPSGFRVLDRVVGWRWAPTFLLITVLFLASLPRHGMQFEYLIYLSLSLFLVSCVIQEDHSLARPLRFGPLKRIGVVSYGVYLMHMLSFNAADRIGTFLGYGGNTWRLVVGACIAWAAAEVSFRTLEAYFLKLKHAFSV